MWAAVGQLLDIVGMFLLFLVGGILYNKAMTEVVCCPGGKIGAITIPAGVKKHVWHNPKAGHEAGNGHGGRRIKEIVGK